MLEGSLVKQCAERCLNRTVTAIDHDNVGAGMCKFLQCSGDFNRCCDPMVLYVTYILYLTIDRIRISAITSAQGIAQYADSACTGRDCGRAGRGGAGCLGRVHVGWWLAAAGRPETGIRSSGYLARLSYTRAMRTAKSEISSAFGETGRDEKPVAVESTFTLAQLSDPHLTSLEGVSPGSLLNKRILGYLSWLKRRRYEHRIEVLDALRDDLAGMNPDHVAVTGDLTHIGLPQEFQQAREWLNALGSPEQVTVIPGNHDTYVATAWEETFANWAPYMASDDMGPDRPASPDFFPSMRIRGDIALIGVSTALPTAPFMATGKMGSKQLERLETLLDQAKSRGQFRILMIHHPPLPGSIKWRKRLVDAERLETVLRNSGAELILHGHAHKTTLRTFRRDGQAIPVIGIPSSSAVGKRPAYRARYHLYRISRLAGAWRMRVEVRGYDASSGRFVAEDDLSL